MADKLIEPRTLKGFRDYPPELMISRERLMEKAREVYRSYGFAPIDTPALEYTEILLGKGGAETDKQLYRFTDHGGRDVALRFDLTVPFARFAAQHIGQLGTPFKRYHIAPVWRGENTQRGRYREFAQCDFDIIGTRSNAADIETALVINDLFTAIGIERFEIRINNRLLLNGLLELKDVADKAVPVLQALDKLSKIGREKVVEEMVREAGISEVLCYWVVGLAEMRGTNDEILAKVEKNFADQPSGIAGPAILGPSPKVTEGISRLRELLAVAKTAGVPDGRIRIDLSICRGLDYYTGTIYETFLTDLPGIGSVCSGGRYDNLASLYTKQVLPGVGASLGLDRLLAAMEELNLLDKKASTAPVLIVQFDAAHLGDYQKMARTLRAAGIGVEVFPDAKKIGAQLAYADKRGYRLALIAGEDEFAKGEWQIKDLTSQQAQAVPAAEVLAVVRKTLKAE